MELPCPRCGNKNVVSTFCARCLRELSPIVEKLKAVKITFCVESGNIKLLHAWEDIPQAEALQKVIARAIVPKSGATIDEIRILTELDQELLRKPGIQRDVIMHVIVKGKADNDIPQSYEEEYDIPITLLTTINPRFAKIGTDYFEGVFQARNETPKRKKAFLEAVANRANRGMAVNKEKSVKVGRDKARFIKIGQEDEYGATDYYVTKKQAMRSIVYELHEKFGGVLKENTRLITHDKLKSKDVHRLTIMIDYPPYDWNDVLMDEEETRILVVKDLGKKIRYHDVKRGKRVEEAYAPGVYHIVETQTAEICQTQPQLGIIDPQTFQQVRLYYAGNHELAVGDKARVIKAKTQWWLVQ